MSHIFITTEFVYNNFSLNNHSTTVIYPHEFFEKGQNQEIFAKKWPYNYLRHTMITRDNSDVLLPLSASYDNEAIFDYFDQNNIPYTITLPSEESLSTTCLDIPKAEQDLLVYFKQYGNKIQYTKAITKKQSDLITKQLTTLNQKYDSLQKTYGADSLNAIYGYGDIDSPIVLVFMNPTKRNIAAEVSWAGLRAQWLGTKQVWNFLTSCGLFDTAVNNKIQSKKPQDWTYEFCEKVYNEVKKQNLWITNLAKCTQDDARPLKDEVFLQYRDLLIQELSCLNPKMIILFGNQVSSIVLEQEISVSLVRQKKFDLSLNGKTCPAYAVYYPVGNGRFNAPKAVEDIKKILNK